MKDKKINKYSLLFLIIFFGLFIFNFASAADGTLFLSPKSGIYSVGDVFSVKVLLDSDGDKINAAEAELIFDPSELFVESVSTEGSIFSLWTIPPEYSNEDGVIEFAGGTKEKYVGSEGLLITIKFKALKSIVSSARLTAGAILAADGKASNIITSMRSGVYTLEPKEILEKAEYITADNTPGVPKIYSDTHPDQNKWYKENDVLIYWDKGDGVFGTRFLVNRSPDSIPNVLYDASINKKNIQDLDDGVWYFHLQMENTNGWGKIGHFRFQIDSEKPDSFNIIDQRGENEEDAIENKINSFLFDAKDAMSGIEAYEVQIDQRDPELWFSKEDGFYTPPPLDSGKHVLLVKALDKAGNYLLDSVSFEVESPESPILIKYPDIVGVDDFILIKGITFPNSNITAWLQKGSEQPIAHPLESDNNGNFTFIAEDKLSEGVYYFWVEAYDANGVKSKASEKITFAVELPGMLKLASSASSFISIIVPFIILLVFIGIVSGYVWHKVDKLKQRSS